MASKLALIFSVVITIAAFVAINSSAAVPKQDSASALSVKSTIYRPDLWRVY